MTTPNLNLPELVENQAQKYLTHNQALNVLDGIVQLSVKDRDLTAPPAEPADGDRYIVAAAATGAWAGHDTQIAHYVSPTGWQFYAPARGWLCFVVDEMKLQIWNGSEWTSLAAYL